MNRGQQFTLLGGIGLLVGAFLPWITITSAFLGLSVSKAGYEGDGVLTGGIGLLLLIIAISAKGKPGKNYSPATIILSGISGLILLNDLLNVNSVIASADSEVLTSIGAGIYLSIIGAILSFIGGLQKVPNLSETPQAEMPVQ